MHRDLPILQMTHFGILHSIQFFFFLFRAISMAQGGSQARGSIGAVADSLHHSHNNAGFELHLQPTPQLTATPDL